MRDQINATKPQKKTKADGPGPGPGSGRVSLSAEPIIILAVGPG